MMQQHNYSLYELENMIAWERQVYIALLEGYIREEKERQKLEGLKH